MEPLGITTGILSIVEAGFSIASQLESSLSDAKLAVEVRLYSHILRETSDIILQNSGGPPSATTSLKLCQQRLDDLQQAVSASTPQIGSIDLALMGFGRSVITLRDIMLE